MTKRKRDAKIDNLNTLLQSQGICEDLGNIVSSYLCDSNLHCLGSDLPFDMDEIVGIVPEMMPWCIESGYYCDILRIFKRVFLFCMFDSVKWICENNALNILNKLKKEEDTLFVYIYKNEFFRDFNRLYGDRLEYNERIKMHNHINLNAPQLIQWMIDNKIIKFSDAIKNFMKLVYRDPDSYKENLWISII